VSRKQVLLYCKTDRSGQRPEITQNNVPECIYFKHTKLLRCQSTKPRHKRG